MLLVSFHISFLSQRDLLVSLAEGKPLALANEKVNKQSTIKVNKLTTTIRWLDGWVKRLERHWRERDDA